MSYNDALAILRNNHWTPDLTKNVWVSPSGAQAISEELLVADPRAAIDAIGLDWDSEMRALNTAWGGTPSKYKAIPIYPGSLVSVDDYTDFDGMPWETYTPPSKPKGCSHEWVKYTGLNEVFTYCKKCDEKQ